MMPLQQAAFFSKAFSPQLRYHTDAAPHAQPQLKGRDAVLHSHTFKRSELITKAAE